MSLRFPMPGFGKNARVRLAGWLGLLLGVLLLSGCTVADDELWAHYAAMDQAARAEQVSPRMEVTPFHAGPCSDTFVRHTLDFTTHVDQWPVQLFASNGSGLGINDLDGDGQLDLVMGNLDGQNAVLWNRGDLVFEREDLDPRHTRAVSIIDIDGDGWLDLTFALRRFIPMAYLNQPAADGGRGFTRHPLSLFANKTYTMAWGDLDGDGDLDAVTATYDAEPVKEEGLIAGTGTGGGVFVMYQNGLSGEFEREQLALTSQALAILLDDFNEDGRLDILVGHDFELPDQVWLQTDDGWREERIFPEVTRNTMSFATGDVDNDGSMELFAADMKPFLDDEETMAQWMPLMEDMDFEVTGGQVMHNVLQARAAEGGFEDRAAALALSATGWTWSAQFGDLDNDGLVDLYAVNGMQAQEMFPYLPDAELVEENLVFRNAGPEGFQWMPEWGLGAREGGRSMGLADLDLDGDLDVVINNLLDPALLFENQLCGGQSMEVDLFWPDSGNTRALGAVVTLVTDQGVLVREVRANSGYLTGEPARLHFGLPEGAAVTRMDVRWPDGVMSHHQRPAVDALITLTRE